MGLFKKVRNILKSIPVSAVINMRLDADPGYFYEVEGGFAIFKHTLKAGPILKGPQIPLNCMFEAYWLLRGSEKVGYYFTSQFQTANHGGYLVTWMNNGAGKATSVEIMLKTDELVVFNYPNRGTLAITPAVNEEISNIFDEQ